MTNTTSRPRPANRIKRIQNDLRMLNGGPLPSDISDDDYIDHLDELINALEDCDDPDRFDSSIEDVNIWRKTLLDY